MEIQFQLLQAATQGSPYTTLIMMTLIFGVFYFFMIRPQAKKQKLQDAYVQEIAKGDEVVTNSGIIGRVNKIDGNVVHLQVDTKTYIKIYRSALSREMSEALKTGDPISEKAST